MDLIRAIVQMLLFFQPIGTNQLPTRYESYYIRDAKDSLLESKTEISYDNKNVKIFETFLHYTFATATPTLQSIDTLTEYWFINRDGYIDSTSNDAKSPAKLSGQIYHYVGNQLVSIDVYSKGILFGGLFYGFENGRVAKITTFNGKDTNTMAYSYEANGNIASTDSGLGGKSIRKLIFTNGLLVKELTKQPNGVDYSDSLIFHYRGTRLSLVEDYEGAKNIGRTYYHYDLANVKWLAENNPLKKLHEGPLYRIDGRWAPWQGTNFPPNPLFGIRR